METKTIIIEGKFKVKGIKGMDKDQVLKTLKFNLNGVEEFEIADTSTLISLNKCACCGKNNLEDEEATLCETCDVEPCDTCYNCPCQCRCAE